MALEPHDTRVERVATEIAAAVQSTAFSPLLPDAPERMELREQFRRLAEQAIVIGQSG